MPLTLGQAAKETGRSKPTILNAINKGRVSARKSETGAWEIEPAELFRVYTRAEPPNGKDEAKLGALETPPSPPFEEGKIRVLEAELGGLKELLEQTRERLGDKDREIEDARRVRDELMAHLRAQTALLTDMREAAERERTAREEAGRRAEAAPPPRRGLGRLFGRRRAAQPAV